MTFNDPRLVVGPTKQRYEARGSKLELIKSVPGTADLYLDENREWQVTETFPQFEGQLIGQQFAGDYTCELYVAVYIPSQVEGRDPNLTWKRVKPFALVIDSGTGKPWDPMKVT